MIDGSWGIAPCGLAADVTGYRAAMDHLPLIRPRRPVDDEMTPDATMSFADEFGMLRERAHEQIAALSVTIAALDKLRAEVEQHHRRR